MLRLCIQCIDRSLGRPDRHRGADGSPDTSTDSQPDSQADYSTPDNHGHSVAISNFDTNICSNSSADTSANRRANSQTHYAASNNHSTDLHTNH